jgi:hypothetical protein
MMTEGKKPDIPPPKLADELYALKKQRERQNPKRESEYMEFIKDNMR